jgi:chromosomal replication initiator protein
MNGVVEIPLKGHPPSGGTAPPGGRGSPVGLSTFVAGPENRLAEVAVQAVLGETDRGYCPIVFYGPSGTGKSHLAVGLATAWKACFRREPVIYVTAVDFARGLGDAIQTKTVDDFTAQYRRVSLLVLEDVGHLAGKEAAQRELMFTLDALSDAQSRVVLTSGVIPSELEGISAGLRGRLTAGLAVPLVPPSRDSRFVILRLVAESRGFELSEAAAGLLADSLSVTAPELFGAAAELEMLARIDGGAIDVKAVERYLVERNGTEQPSIHEIALGTAKHFSLTLKELRGPSRRRAVATARAVAMYLARSLTTESLQQIGQYFGRRDHTTVSHSCQKTEERLEIEPDVRRAVFELQKLLQVK